MIYLLLKLSPYFPFHTKASLILWFKIYLYTVLLKYFSILFIEHFLYK